MDNLDAPNTALRVIVHQMSWYEFAELDTRMDTTFLCKEISGQSYLTCNQFLIHLYLSGLTHCKWSKTGGGAVWRCLSNQPALKQTAINALHPYYLTCRWGRLLVIWTTDNHPFTLNPHLILRVVVRNDVYNHSFLKGQFIFVLSFIWMGGYNLMMEDNTKTYGLLKSR